MKNSTVDDTRDLNPARSGHHVQREPGFGFEREDGNSRFVSTEQFDYDRIDALLAGKDLDESLGAMRERDIFMLFGSMWGEVMEWVYVPKNPRLIGLRFLAVVYVIRPAMFGDDATLEKIGKTGGITKQTFQDLTAKFRDHFKVVCRSMRKEESRKTMQASALKTHAKKKGKNA